MTKENLDKNKILMLDNTIIRNSFDNDENVPDGDGFPENVGKDSEQKKSSNDTKGKNIQKDNDTPMLNKFGNDITKAAEEGKLDPVVGRSVEIERVIQILSRRKRTIRYS